MEYYPEERIILENTLIQRRRVLPDGVTGEVLVQSNHDVQGTETIARGQAPQQYRIVDIASALNVNRDDQEQLDKYITLQPGSTVQKGQALAEALKRRDRNRVPVASSDGIVRLVDQGRMILQINPRPVEVKARIKGTVTRIIPDKGAEIETSGAYIQCVWGNGNFTFSHFEFEPEEGIRSLEEANDLLANFHGRVYILERPISMLDLSAVARFKLAGLIAPCMPYNLRKAAMAFKVPIILTEGFGELSGTSRIYRILRHLQSRAAALDARTPERWSGERPEIIIPSSLGSEPVPKPATDKALVAGMPVRIQREPYAGLVGEVVELPEGKQRIESGLRVSVARVKVPSLNRIVTVPVANLQGMGTN